MYLVGDTIYFKDIRESDLTQTYCDWLNDPEVNRYLETRWKIQTLETIYNYWVDHVDQPDESWLGIWSKKTDSHIGNIKLGPINWYHRRGDISLFIGTPVRFGKGYGSEAINLMVDHAFNNLNLHKVTAGIYSGNTGSIKAFGKCGFNHVGTLKDHVFCEGSYQHLLLMEKVNSDS